MCVSMQNNVKSFLEDDPNVAKCCCLDDDPNMKIETGANDQDRTGDNLGKVNRPTMFFYLAVATIETKSGANFFA